MKDKRVKIKYRQEGYDPKLAEKLSAAAIALGGEFSDCAMGDSLREMSFKFETVENLRTFFGIWKRHLAEKEEDQDKSRKDWLA